MARVPSERGVAQLGSALAWGARGRKFKSCRPDLKLKVIHFELFLYFFKFNVINSAFVQMSNGQR